MVACSILSMLTKLIRIQFQAFQLDCSPSLPTEPQLRLEAAKSTTGKLNVVVVHVVPHTISFVTSRDVARRPTT